MSRRKDPIDTIVWTPAEELHPNDWNPNRVLTAELVLLERSLLVDRMDPARAGCVGQPGDHHALR